MGKLYERYVDSLHLGSFKAATVLALERHIHARAGGSSAQQLPLIVAKDLGLFEKHGLNLDLLEIRAVHC